MNNTKEVSKRTDALINRAHLLTVAQVVFAENGLDLEINDIASRAQLGVGTLYRHFGNREELLRTIVIQTVEDAQMQIRQAIQPHAENPRDMLQALVAAELLISQQYLPLFATLRDRRLAKLFDLANRDAIRSQFLDPARWVIEQGIQAGVFRKKIDPDIAAATIIGAITSVFELLGESNTFDEIQRQLFQLLWAMFTQ